MDVWEAWKFSENVYQWYCDEKNDNNNKPWWHLHVNNSHWFPAIVNDQFIFIISKLSFELIN